MACFCAIFFAKLNLMTIRINLDDEAAPAGNKGERLVWLWHDVMFPPWESGMREMLQCSFEPLLMRDFMNAEH